MALLAPGDHVQEVDTEAAWPIWKVTVTPQGGSPLKWANVTSGAFSGIVTNLGDIVRQAKLSTRGSLKVTVSNLAGASTLAGGLQWEGADVEVRVAYGAVDDVVWVGVVDEVLREDQLYFAFQAREGRNWIDRELLTTVEASEYPDAPSASLGLGKPVVLGVVPNFVPVLVEDVATTILTVSMGSLDTAAEVDSTGGFDASGSIKIGAESMTYASITATSFVGLVRASPDDHVPGDTVLEVGQMTYLVANHTLHNVSAMSSLRLETSSGALAPVPADIVVTPSVSGGLSTITFDRQPEVAASISTPSALKFLDLDTVAFSDLSAADAAKCLGLADGFVDVDQSILVADGDGTGGQRVASILLPAGSVIERVWLVVEHFDEREAETTTTATLSAVAGTVLVASTAAFPSSGQLIISSGSRNSELVSYTGTTANSFTGLLRGLNSDHQTPISYPSGTRISWSSGIVHLDLAGGDADDANVVGALETKQAPPEVVSCNFFPSVREFDSQHLHEIPAHDHGLWSSIHAHTATKGFTVFADGVWVDPGNGGATGSPEISGSTSVLQDGADKGFTPIPVGADISATLQIPGYPNTNWYALTFPGALFASDARKVVGCEAFVMVSGGASMQVVTDGVPAGPVNPGTIPYFGFSSFPMVPPELDVPSATPFGTSVIGTSGIWTTNSTWLTSPLTPNSGDDIVIERDPSTPTNAHDAWGGNGGTGALNKYRSLPGNMVFSFVDGTPDESTVRGYARISLLDAGLHEYVGYHGLEWANFGPARVRLKNIVRGLNLTLPQAWPSGGDTRIRFTTHGCHHLATRHIGAMEPATFPGDNAPTLAQLAAAAPVPSIYQTNMAPIWAAVEASQFRNVGTIYELTVADFFRRRETKTFGGSKNPFDTDSSDRTKIHPQYNAMRPEIVALAPVIWVQACEGMNLHSAWIEVITEEPTTDGEFGTLAPTSQGPTNPEEPLGVSTLSWFDITDRASSAADLEGATVKVVKNDDLAPVEDLRILRQFFVVELSGLSTSKIETPKRLVLNVEGAGVVAPGGTVDGAELVRQLVVEGLGQVSADVLNEASFTAAGAQVLEGGVAYTETAPGEDVIEELAASFRLVPTWDADGKLSVTYLPHRLNLPTPSKTFTANDIYWGSVYPTRGKLGDVTSQAVVRGAENYVDGGHDFVGSDTSSSAPVVDNRLELDADALRTQAAVDELADHIVQYGEDVPLRVAFTTFTQGLDVFPAATIGIVSGAYTSSGLFVERVILRPSSPDPGFCEIECRDLTLEAGSFMGLSYLDGNVAPYNADATAASDASSAIQDAVNAAVAGGFAGVDLSTGRYRMDTTVNVNGPCLIRFSNGTAAIGNPTATNAGITRCEWNGGADGKMFVFAPAVPAAGTYLHKSGLKDVVLAGRFNSAGRAVAGYGYEASDCVAFLADNIRTEFFKAAGGRLTTTNGNIVTRQRLNGLGHTWGTDASTAGERDSHGLEIDQNNSVGGNAQGRVYDVSGLFYNGSGIHITGNCDNWSFRGIQAVRQAGGAGGKAITCVDNSDPAKASPRNHAIGYINGGFHQGGASRGNWMEQANSEGLASGVSADDRIPGVPSVVHFTAIDYAHGDLFQTHRYPMTDQLRVDVGAFTPTSAIAPTHPVPSFAAYLGSWEFTAGVLRSVGASLSPPYRWNDGTITKIRVFYGLAVAPVGTISWDLRTKLGTYADGVNLTLPDDAQTNSVDITGKLLGRSYSYDVVTNIAYTRDDTISFEIARVAPDAYLAPGHVYLLGALLLYKCDGPNSGGSGTFIAPPPQEI